MKGVCGSCTQYERSGKDYGECILNPSWSYTHCKASCEDYKRKTTKRKTTKKEN